MSTLCDDCKASGLPILPVRYAVVPANIQPAMPSWTSGERVKDVDLGQDYHYALRTLRSGFVYLFFSKHARGADLWECYAVTPAGLLIKQPNPAMARPVLDFACKAQGHLDARLHHLVIEKPEACGPTWIAFSEHAWSKETVAEYTSNSKLRNARMQTIHPNKMAGGAKHSHGTIASKEALQQVLEYAPGFSPELLPYDGRVSVFSEENGKFKAELLSKQSTRTPWHRRDKEVDQTLALMTARAKRNDGGQNSAHVLALWDAIGITHELNGFRNEVAGRVQQYGNERELQITALNAIDGLKKALADKGEARARDVIAERDKHRSMGYDPSIPKQRRARALKSPDSPFRRAELRHCDLMEYLGAKGLFRAYEFDLGRIQFEPDPKKRMAMYDALQVQVDARVRNQPLEDEEDVKAARAYAWPRYEEKLDPKLPDLFRTEWNSFLEQSDALIDRRAEVQIRWLESDLLIDTLEDFHPTSIEDGVLFEDVVGDAIFGLRASKVGTAKIDAWVREARAHIKSNLLWRAIALNQAAGIAELDVALKEAEEHKHKRTLANAAVLAGYLAKTLKVFPDTFKKATSAYNTNTSASSASGSKAFGAKIKPVNTRGFDKIAAECGDKVFRYFRVEGAADFLSEKIIQHMFSIRAMVDPSDSIRLIVVQAANETEARGQLVRRMQASRVFLGENSAGLKTAQAENLRNAWSEFKQKNSGAATSIKDARLALVVMLVEGVNTQKLMAECILKNDMKSWGGLVASGLTLSSGLFDLASVPAKALFGAESWSYQKMKLYGGLLGAGATALGAVIDVSDAVKYYGKDQKFLMYLYAFKATLGVVGSAFTVAATFTYAAPMIERLSGRTLTGAAVRAVGARAAAIIGARILFMTAGAWITVATFGVQVIIWIVADDKLQDWASLCAFGKKRTAADAYKTASKQSEELTAAMIEVGVAA